MHGSTEPASRDKNLAFVLKNSLLELGVVSHMSL